MISSELFSNVYIFNRICILSLCPGMEEWGAFFPVFYYKLILCCWCTDKVILTLQASRSRRRSWSSSWPTSRWGCCGGAGAPRRARLCGTPSLTRCWPLCPTSWSRLSERADPRPAFKSFVHPGMSSRSCSHSYSGHSVGHWVLKTVQLSEALKERCHILTSEASRHLKLVKSCPNLTDCDSWRWS